LRGKYNGDTIPWLHGRSLRSIYHSLSISVGSRPKFCSKKEVLGCLEKPVTVLLVW